MDRAPSPPPSTACGTGRARAQPGQRVSFGTAATVEVTLSPSGSTLQAPGLPTNFDLPATLLTFDVGDFSAPVRAFKPFSPTDAIGSSDLEGSSPILQVELAEPAQVGDVLELYLFGTDSAEDEEVALFRSITVAAPSALLDVFPADLALIDTTVSPDPLLADGEVRIATVASARRFRQRCASSRRRRDDGRDPAVPARYQKSRAPRAGHGRPRDDDVRLRSARPRARRARQ